MDSGIIYWPDVGTQPVYYKQCFSRTHQKRSWLYTLQFGCSRNHTTYAAFLCYTIVSRISLGLDGLWDTTNNLLWEIVMAILFIYYYIMMLHSSIWILKNDINQQINQWCKYLVVPAQMLSDIHLQSPQKQTWKRETMAGEKCKCFSSFNLLVVATSVVRSHFGG